MIISLSRFYVASLAEAWIEITDDQLNTVIARLSPPSRRRRLKYFGTLLHSQHYVASLAEAWIEIAMTRASVLRTSGRLPRGGVD